MTPLNTISYNIITNTDNQDIVLGVIDQQPRRGTTFEIIISFEGSSVQDAHARTIKNITPGQKVRIYRDLYADHVGTIKSIHQDTVDFASGFELAARYITLNPNEEQITVPPAKLSL
jgi:transcription antitermination factor NusG